MARRKAAFAEESAEYEVFYASMDKFKELTTKIQASMTRLETSGRVVQEQIAPVYGNTQKLQTTNSNIDRVIAAIARVREPLDMRTREERIIRSAPQRVGLTDYMASIDRTRDALRDMQQTKLKSNQQSIAELNSLLQLGLKQIEDLFRNILSDGQPSIEPLHFITKQVDFPRLPMAKTVQLQTLHRYIAANMTATASVNGRPVTTTVRTYADVRGEYIAASLQNLSSACGSTARRQHPEARYVRQQNAISAYAKGLKGIFIAEYNSIGQVFSREETAMVLSMTCQRSLQAFNSTVRDLNQHIKEHILSDCYLAFEIIEELSESSASIEAHTGVMEIKDAIAYAIKPIRETAKGSLAQIIGDVRARTSAQQLLQLPPDGGSLPYTSEVMERLQALTGYMVPLASALTSLGDGGWSTPNTGSSQSVLDGKVLFAHYCLDVIETLLSSLQMRAYATLKTKSSQGVFMANTVAVIERKINSPELNNRIDGSQQKLEMWRKKATALYLDAWRETSGFLLDVQYTNRGARPTSTSTGVAIDSAAVVKALSNKDKDAIKEKFRSFNASFDDNVQRNRSYRMEREVQAHLAREVQMFIEALYGRFWDRYHDIDKGKGKYVRYDKAQLGATLARMA